MLPPPSLMTARPGALLPVLNTCIERVMPVALACSAERATLAARV